MKKHIIFLLVLLSAIFMGNAVFGAIIVGRISHVDGQIYRYMDVDQSWVETFTDSPVGTQDIITVGDDSRAEINFSNNILVQVGQNAEMEILNLEEDEAEIFLQTGITRFFNRGPAVRLTVETAGGVAEIGPGSVADIKVDAKTVTIAVVKGNATFQPAGSDSLEVLSGSTRLEFSENSVIAGKGSIDSNWDRWCRERENFWSQNRLVRSEYLPETMQEYAYVLEPYGNWQRIYYRGYYYWAWQPRHVAVGWAPYTTGYWYDWHGDSVWIDYNPWGWATHHHGHWIHMHGAWMWTPYVHVSHVPGVTVVGLNITYGKRFRPYWHPGRVRWISYSTHIGWLPLAPWETYYGCRSWGPRSVVVSRGAGFSINVNLSHHRYVDHAVIIEKKHFHKRGRVARNYYSDIRIRNINKTVVVNNYKPLPMAEERRSRQHEAKVSKGDGARNRAVRLPEKNTRQTRNDSKMIRQQRNEYREKSYSQLELPAKQERGKAVKREREVRKEKNRKNFVKQETGTATRGTRNEVKQVESGQRITGKRSIPAANSPRQSKEIVKSDQVTKESRGKNVQIARSRDRTQRNEAAAKNSEKAERLQARKGTRVSQRQDKRAPGEQQAYKEKSGKNSENERQATSRQKKQRAEPRQYGNQQAAARNWQGERQRSDRFYASGSVDNRRLR